jgi:hypothetical protein
MSNYDEGVFRAREEMTKLLVVLVSGDTRKRDYAIEQLPDAVECLNRAWDELTNCLVRQRRERDEQISRLMSELAEAKKPR